MITNCKQINLIIDFLKKHENTVLDVTDGWTKVKTVIYMKLPLNVEMKREIQKENSSLRYRKFDGSLNYPADEGFICDEHSVAISFPVKKID